MSNQRGLGDAAPGTILGARDSHQASPDDVSSANFAEMLIREAGKGRKGARTRARICAALCRELDTMALSTLTVGGICRRAGVAHGTFYIYFSDRDGLIEAVLEQFVGYLQAQMHRAARQGPEDPARASTAAYFDLFEHNRGLMKVMINHLDGFPVAQQAFQALNRDWLETVVQATARKLARTGRSIPNDELMRRAYALGGMTDQYLTGLFLSDDPNIGAVSQDKAAVVDTLNLIWQRGMAP